jgi:hypothetical protein
MGFNYFDCVCTLVIHHIGVYFHLSLHKSLPIVIHIRLSSDDLFN